MAKIPQNNKQHLFASIYSKWGTPTMKFIFKRMGANQDAAEEIFAKTIYAAWKGFDTFSNKSSYFTWICRIALNKIADYYRDQINRNSRIITPLLEEIANIYDTNISPEEKLALDELRISVRQCLDLLPKEKRQLLYLRYWREMTIAEIAKVFGTSERAIEGKIYRAKKALGQIIEIKHPEISPSYQDNENR